MSKRRDVRVLIAEDSYLVSSMIRGLLQELGYDVVGEATNGVEAVEMTQSIRPDVVLMDIRMPDMDGLEAARRIHGSCPTPVVVLTSYETAELVAEAGAAGVGAYLTKPPNAREIERAIIIAMSRFADMMELSRLNAELQAQNEELDAFAHTVAHDLKHPLSLITGYVDLLKLRYTTLSDKEREAYLDRILWNGHKMSNITEELLLFAEIRKEEVAVEPLDMAGIVDEARRRLAHMINEYQAEVFLPDSWPKALGYGPWVEEIWVNYVSNAIKYGGVPPRVELGWTKREEGTISFWARDNGPGLSPEEQARLFKPLTRLSQVRTKGYGLGLSIVRRIVEKLGGRVSVESDPGQGCVFGFTLSAEG